MRILLNNWGLLKASTFGLCLITENNLLNFQVRENFKKTQKDLLRLRNSSKTQVQVDLRVRKTRLVNISQVFESQYERLAMADPNIRVIMKSKD